MSFVPSKLAWSAFVKTSLHCLFRDTFDSSATSMPSLSDLVALEPPKLSKIHPILTYTKGDTRFVRINNLRLRLLLHCSFSTSIPHLFALLLFILRSRPFVRFVEMVWRTIATLLLGARASGLAKVHDKWCSQLGKISSTPVFDLVFGKVWESHLFIQGVFRFMV